MTRFEVRALLVATVLLLVTGVALGVSKRLLARDDPFSAVGSPWQPWALKVHILAAPVFLFIFGSIFRRHVLVKMRGPERRGRTSGALCLWLIALLTVTGYGFEILTGEGVRNSVSLVHLGAGIAFGGAYLVHSRLGPASAAAYVDAAARRVPRVSAYLRRRGAKEPCS